MGTPAIKFHLSARPTGVGPSHWPTYWEFDGAYNPGGYPPDEYNWDHTTLWYHWQRIGSGGLPEEEAVAADDLDEIRSRATLFLRHSEPYQFEFKVFWDHGECLCTRDYDEKCPIHHIDEEDDVVRWTEPPEETQT